MELSQHGWAIVTVVPAMDATGQRTSVHGPTPDTPRDQSALPPVYTNSMSPGLRQPAIVAALARYPVEFFVRLTGSRPTARVARRPST